MKATTFARWIERWRSSKLVIGFLLALLTGVGPLQAPQVALADDAAVSTCTEAGFDAALDAVQSSGGGTITFDCAGTITFSSEKKITSSVTIIGNGGVIFDGNGATRLFSVNAPGNLHLVYLTLQNGFALDGAAVLVRFSGRLEVSASTFRNNRAGFGGAIFVGTGGTAAIASSTFTDNTADTRGGAISTTGQGTATIVTDSTFSGNSSTNFGGALSITLDADATVTTSTFDGNSSGRGGAAYSDTGGVLSVNSSTFGGNSASLFGGALDSPGGTVTIDSSIVAASPSGGNCSGSISSNGSNLSDDASCGFNGMGDIQNSGAINLGALADNGGPTETMLPQSGSDAIGNADCTLSSAQDQRGATRPSSGCDIGAVESSGRVSAQLITVHSRGGAEAGAVTVSAIAFGPINDNLDYAFDCDNDGSYETPGSGSGNVSSADCSFDDDGTFTVGVQVCDAVMILNCDTDSATVNIDNLNPSIIIVTNDGPVGEGSPATIQVRAVDPNKVNDPLSYAFDCDDNGSYETPGSGAGGLGLGACVFGDNGTFTVGVQVSDDDGGFDTDSSTVVVNNVVPAVNQPSVDVSPSTEGQSVVASATFDDPGTLDTHTCTVDYGNGPAAGTVAGNTCTGPAHTYLDDDPSGSSSDQYTVTIVVTDDDGDSGDNSVIHTVNNVAPVIESITTNGPVPQGQPVAVTVQVSDVGVNDTHTYVFDCDEDGAYETAGSGNQGQCALDPAAASTMIGVQVTDDDGGMVTGVVAVGQTLTLCRYLATGALAGTLAGGACSAGHMPVVLPAIYPMTLCIHLYTGAIGSAQGGGACPAGQRSHVVPHSGPLPYCKSTATNKLRFSSNGACSVAERAGVIPG